MNGIKNQILILNDSVIKEVQRACFSHLEEEITERHDRPITEAEKAFRALVDWPDEDEAIDVCWQRLSLATEAMYLEMVQAAFVAGIEYGYGLGSGNGQIVVNGRVSQFPTSKGVEA